MNKFIDVCKEAVDIQSKYGHSDIGDIFVSLLKQEVAEDRAIEFVLDLISDYRKE